MATAKKKPAKKPAAKKKAAPAKKRSASSATNRKKLPAYVSVERDRSRFLHDGEHFGATSLALHTIGHLETPSGTIVTCDPFIVDGPALARTVEPGSYPVSLAVATFDGEQHKGDQRVAAATVHFRPGVPARWEVATFDATPTRKGGEPGYPVDAGTGCFMDARAQEAIKAEPTIWPTPSQKALEQQLLTDHYTHTWSWAVYRPDPASRANCVAFMSGYGDGTYSSYWGLDETGAPVCLTTDFEVFTDEDWAAMPPALRT
ncbi:MAG: DUF4241 domain-containing protein [Deltaproteobacteria bacterium]|nr:DUF4241 domain-containing protein [Kofleriaceae bacterium]